MITIEKMTQEDVPRVIELGSNIEAFKVSDGDCFWSQPQLEAWVRADEDILLVAKEEGVVVGFTLTTLHRPTGKVTWENLYVLPEFRAQGTSNRLIEKLLSALRGKGASYLCGYVRAENTIEMSYLRSRGFDIGHNFAWISRYL